MEWRVRHRQPKGTVTDGPSWTPPRRPSTRPPRTGPPPERSGPAPQEKLAVWVGSLAGGEPREIWRPAHDELSAYSSLAWDARGGGLFVGVRTKSVRELPRADQIWYVPIDGGDPHATGIAMPGVAISDVHPAGRRIGFTSSVNARQLWTLKNFLDDGRTAK